MKHAWLLIKSFSCADHKGGFMLAGHNGLALWIAPVSAHKGTMNWVHTKRPPPEPFVTAKGRSHPSQMPDDSVLCRLSRDAQTYQRNCGHKRAAYFAPRDAFLEPKMFLFFIANPWFKCYFMHFLPKSQQLVDICWALALTTRSQCCSLFFFFFYFLFCFDYEKIEVTYLSCENKQAEITRHERLIKHGGMFTLWTIAVLRRKAIAKKQNTSDAFQQWILMSRENKKHTLES